MGVFTLRACIRRDGDSDDSIVVEVFLDGSAGVQLILGLNGVVWVSVEVKLAPQLANASLLSDAQPAKVRDIAKSEREAIARVSNCIRALAKLYFSIHPTSIMNVYSVGVRQQVNSSANRGRYPRLAGSSLPDHHCIDCHVTCRPLGVAASKDHCLH